jgi:two-component system alkaline phosphatase synthesis response regulator PhoP
MNNKYKILLVDDEQDILEFLGYNLLKEGYEIFKSKNGKEAIKIAQEIIPDLIVLDIMMPEMDGIECCLELKKIKSLNKTIITFLTASGEDYSHIAGLDSGADDYITKPIKPNVFISRIKALLRRNEKEELSVITIDNIIIDRNKYMITKDGIEIKLPRKEFELMWLLASNPNKVCTRQDIYNKVWGNVCVGYRTIDVHIRKIRHKLNTDNIKTIKSVGYKFETLR